MAEAGSASAQARRLLALREQRLRELAGELHARSAEVSDPQLTEALSQVELALAGDLPATWLPCGLGSSEALGEAKGLPRRHSLGSARASTGSARPSSARHSLGSSLPGSCRASSLALTPRSPSNGQRSRAGRSLAAQAAAAQLGGVAQLCREADEVLAPLPTRSAEVLKKGFQRLLGELQSLEQRVLSQAKAAEQMQAAISAMPTPAESAQHLQNVEEDYQRHIERLSGPRDKSKARKLMEANTRAKMYSERTAELVSEIEQLRRQKPAERKESFSPSAAVVNLEHLKAAIEEKERLVATLERDLPSAQRIMEEHNALSRRVAQLSAEMARAPHTLGRETFREG